MTLASILALIKRDLEWRGPSDGKQGHIVLPREEAQYLHDHVIALIIERDNLVNEQSKQSKV